MSLRISRSNFTDQVAIEISESIRTRKFKPGDQLPSVEKLATEMGVGRSTVREGLRLLQARGLVEIIHGVGTFVAQEQISRVTGVLVSFSQTILERGMTPSAQVLSQDKVSADDETASRLQIQVGDPVHVLKRLRFADKVPMAVETSIIPYDRFADVMEQDWGGQASLYAFLYDRYQVYPHTAAQTVQAVTAGRTQSQLLLISTRSPVLLIETVAYDQSGSALEFGRSYYRADRYEYRVQLKHT